MKVRKIKSVEQAKDDEYIIDCDNNGLLAVKLNIEYVFTVTSYLFRLSINEMQEENEINTFVTNNIKKAIDIVEQEIEEFLQNIFDGFCNEKDSFLKVKIFVSIFNKRIERFIAWLIVGNFRKRILSSYYSTRRTKQTQ